MLIKNNIEFPEFNLFNIIMIILYFFILLFIHFLYYTIINKFGPIHSSMSDIISTFILELIFYNQYNSLSIAFGILSIISCLIYLEIIELNFCNLNKNIKKNISKRGEKEIIEQLIINDSISSIENDTHIIKI